MANNDEFRKSIIDVLTLLSSKTRQLEYKLKNPSVNVALEILCKWFNELCSPEIRLFKRSFRTNEIELIQKFNCHYNQCKGKVPETIEELHQDSDWEKIILEAAEILKIINLNESD